MEGGQESGMANLCLLNVDADDATDIVSTDIVSSDSKVLGEGLNVGEKGLRGERGVTGDVIMGLPPMSLLVEALPAGKLLVSLLTYRQTKSPYRWLLKMHVSHTNIHKSVRQSMGAWINWGEPEQAPH